MTDQPIILSYHRFGNEWDDYPFSRTYEQFYHDIEKKEFQTITIDDGHESMIKACEMMTAAGIRAMLFVPTALIGVKGYCTWEQLKELSELHYIESHGHEHVNLTLLPKYNLWLNLRRSIDLIEKKIGRTPTHFASPWNQYDEQVDQACKELNLIPVKNRIDIRNNTK